MTLIDIRKKRGLTQEQFAELIGVDQRTVSAYETGSRRPSYEVIGTISGIFNVPIEQLWQIFARPENPERHSALRAETPEDGTHLSAHS